MKNRLLYEKYTGPTNWLSDTLLMLLVAVPSTLPVHTAAKLPKGLTEAGILALKKRNIWARNWLDIVNIDICFRIHLTSSRGWLTRIQLLWFSCSHLALSSRWRSYSWSVDCWWRSFNTGWWWVGVPVFSLMLLWARGAFLFIMWHPLLCASNNLIFTVMRCLSATVALLACTSHCSAGSSCLLFRVERRLL